ncbi:DUF397 domain-containing protein [Streptomyces bohaiensis]|uniref:DUF397 domain-containing protein n=1 Tax=Streptomyces bohaiensis TaxID=1431344 RepID=A0ABX1CDE8_9ACTN|nr:DUF397 domain-containing protein [Streptomyces bohaiensis]NJQ15232.1 DUF397 domain-containing protein [Streptomyces bohaiensis]
MTGNLPTPALSWHKSSYSDGAGGNCLETSDGLAGVMSVRDSKNLAGPTLAVPTGAFAAFVNGVKSGSLHR